MHQKIQQTSYSRINSLFYLWKMKILVLFLHFVLKFTFPSL